MTPDDLTQTVTVVGLAFALGFMFATVVATGWVILRAARYEPASMLVVILGILAVVAIMAALADPELAGDFVTLSATAIGALAAALTSWRLTTRGTDETPSPTQPGDTSTGEDPGEPGLRAEDGPDGDSGLGGSQPDHPGDTSPHGTPRPPADQHQ